MLRPVTDYFLGVVRDATLTGTSLGGQLTPDPVGPFADAVYSDDDKTSSGAAIMQQVHGCGLTLQKISVKTHLFGDRSA